MFLATSIININLVFAFSPSLVITNKQYTDEALAISGVEDEDKNILNMSFKPLNKDNFKYMLFQAYFRKKDKGAWFEYKPNTAKNTFNPLVIDEPIKVIASGSELHGTRSLNSTDMLLSIRPVEGKLFQITKGGNLCLAVTPAQNIFKGKVLRFEKCNEKDEQLFAFVSPLKASCMVGIEDNCKEKKLEIKRAEEWAKSRMEMLAE